ncbi:MAG: hypothetical protein ABI282_00445 [Candidatus Baltobacteraceae bacterium]
MAGATFGGRESFAVRMKTWTFLLLAAALAVVPAAAAAQDNCSRETLPVRGTPVTIGYCVSDAVRAAGEVSVAAAGTFSAPGGSYSRSSTMRFITGEGPSRVLENVPLAQLGLRGTLHLTLVYSGGLLHIESALLTPGAITIK